MKSFHTHRDKGFLGYLRKNKALASGLAAVVLTILFVSTIIISGKSTQLGMLSQTNAANPVVKFQDATCSSAIVSTDQVVSGSYTVNVLNGSGDLVGQSAAFNFTGETHYVTFPSLGSSDYFSFNLKKNGVTFGTHSPNENYRFNLVCPAPTVWFSQHTCNSVQVATSQALSGTYQVGVSFSNGGERDRPTEFINRSRNFTFNGQNATATFERPLNSNDDFYYTLLKNDVMVGRIGFGSPKALECYADPTPTPTPPPSWKVNMQAVCPNGNAPTRMSGSVGTRWRPYPYTVNGQEVGYTDGGAANATGLSVITAPVINRDLNWFAYMFYRYPNGGALVQTLPTIGAMPNSHFESHDYNPDNLRYQITWDEQTPVNTYTVKFKLPNDAPECAGTTTQGQRPVGNVDGVYNDSSLGYVVSGWSLDPDSTSTKIKVHIYADKEFSASDTSGYAGEVVADDPRSDLTAEKANHAFNWVVPARFKDGNAHTFYVYPIDYPSNTGYDIGGGKAFSIGKVTYTFPTASASPSGSPVACSNKDIMMVMDTSGSMSGSKIRDAKAGVKALVAKLPSNANARAGLVGFGTHAYIAADMTQTMSKVTEASDKLRASGGTNLAEGITTGSSKIAADNRTHVMLIMTDGIANLPRPREIGPNEPAAYASAQAAATEAVAAEVARGLRTVFYTVGLGSKSQLNSTWLDALARGTGGKSVYVSKSTELDNKFTELVTEMCKETPASGNPEFLNNLRGLTAPRQ